MRIHRAQGRPRNSAYMLQSHILRFGTRSIYVAEGKDLICSSHFSINYYLVVIHKVSDTLGSQYCIYMQLHL